MYVLYRLQPVAYLAYLLATFCNGFYAAHGIHLEDTWDLTH